MKKRNGKISIDQMVQDVKNIAPQIPTISIRDDIDIKVKRMIDKIKNNYTYDKCVVIVGDPDVIPDTLRELIIGNGINGINARNVDVYYIRYQRGDYDAFQFLCDIEALLTALVTGFDSLVDLCLANNNNYKGKEAPDYERS